MEEETQAPAIEKPKVCEVEVERWQEGLMQCSFDQRHYKNIDPPTPEVVGTVNERFIGARTEILTGLGIMRTFSDIAQLPDRYPIPEHAAPVYDRVKTIFALSLSLNYAAKRFANYNANKFVPKAEELASIDNKLKTIMRF